MREYERLCEECPDPALCEAEEECSALGENPDEWMLDDPEAEDDDSK